MKKRLNDLRKEIDNLDKAILEKLAKRFEVVREIGELKNDDGLSIEDKVREEELFGLYEQAASELGLDINFVKELFNLIINESKRIQR